MDKLENDTLRIETTPYSASLHSLVYKPFERELTLTLESEEAHTFHPSYSGCTIFPFAGRIKGGVFQNLKLDRNDGENSLHGGRDSRLAVFEKIKSTPSSVSYRTYRKKGEDNIDGNRVYTVTYSLEGDTLSITHEMASDKPVISDTTCHLYFNLGSDENVLNHRIRLDEDAIVLNNEDHTPQSLIPTKGTLFDLNEERTIESINSLGAFSFSRGLNNAYRLSGKRILHLLSGDLMMEAAGTSVGVVLYSGGYLERKAGYIAVEFEDLPFKETRTVTEYYRRDFSFTFRSKCSRE